SRTQGQAAIVVHETLSRRTAVARLDPLPLEDLTPEQNALHAVLGGSRNGRVSGPFAIWLRNPAVADAANKLTWALRDSGKVEKRLYELIVLIITRYWSARYAWASHEGAAAAAGISPETIEAIRNQQKPDFKKDD